MRNPAPWIVVAMIGVSYPSIGSALAQPGTAARLGAEVAGSAGIGPAGGASGDPSERPADRVGVGSSLRTQFPQEAGGNEAAAGRPQRGSDWVFTLSPYLWAMSVRLEVDSDATTANAEACFSDLIKDLDGAAQLRFEGIRDRLGFYLDGTYLSMGDDARAKIGPFRVRGVEVETEVTQAWLDFGGMYRVGEPERHIDLMFGGRYAYMGTELSVGPFADVDESGDFVAPMLGCRLHLDLTDRWMFSLRGDVGGFGVGDAADSILGAVAIFGYRMSETTTLGFGYRYQDSDFSGDRADTDVQFHGPVVGVAFQF